MKKILLVLLGALITIPFSVSALSTFVTVQGGTGTTTPSGILYGDNGATSHLNTVTIGSNLTFSGGTLSATGGSSAFPFTPTSYGNSTSTTIGFLGGLISNGSTTVVGLTSGLVVNNNGHLFGTASSSLDLPNTALQNSSITVNGTAIALGASGTVTAASSTLLSDSNTFSGTLNTFSNAPKLGTLTGLIKGSSGTLSAASNGTDYTLITAITCTNQLLSAFTAAGVGTCSSINNADWSGTQLSVGNGGTGQTSFTSGQLLYGNGTAALSSVATSSISLGSGLTNSSGTLGAQVGGTNVTLKQVENRGFSYASSTTMVGTTTIPLGVAYGEAWQTAKCYTDTGTLNVDFYHNTTHFQFFNASTTIGTVNMGNTTDTSGDKVYVDIGTPTGSVTKLSCTIQDQI